jgi:peptide chain release factor 1
MRSVVVEVRAAEGGEHSKRLVVKQFTIYAKLANRMGLALEVVDDRPGMIVVQAKGSNAFEVFKNESGGHRWQEVSGRTMQTSTITVAVLPEPTATQVVVREEDLDWKYCRGSGAGGQHRNVTDSAVILTHSPTGIKVRCESERSQHANKETALEILRARIWDAVNEQRSSALSSARREQVGSGMRADKRRTIRSQDGIVTDHVLNRQWQLKKYLRGDWD